MGPFWLAWRSGTGGVGVDVCGGLGEPYCRVWLCHLWLRFAATGASFLMCSRLVCFCPPNGSGFRLLKVCAVARRGPTAVMCTAAPPFPVMAASRRPGVFFASMPGMCTAPAIRPTAPGTGELSCFMPTMCAAAPAFPTDPQAIYHRDGTAPPNRPTNTHNDENSSPRDGGELLAARRALSARREPTHPGPGEGAPPPGRPLHPPPSRPLPPAMPPRPPPPRRG